MKPTGRRKPVLAAMALALFSSAPAFAIRSHNPMIAARLKVFGIETSTLWA